MTPEREVKESLSEGNLDDSRGVSNYIYIPRLFFGIPIVHGFP
jgi:hypothetical protein